MTGADVIKLRDQLRTTRTPMEGHWDDLSQLFMPFRLTTQGHVDIPSADLVNDSTARQCAMILANGLASLIIPREEVWFEWAPPKEQEKDEDAVRFYREASTTTREWIERSNFYEEIQEFLIDSPVFGTAGVFIGDDEADGLFFRHLECKTYFIAEDARGRVTTIIRELLLTPDQAAAEFGEDELPKRVSNKVGKPEGTTEKSTYLHAVFANRAPSEADAPDSERKPWKSIVVEEQGKKIVQSGGFEEFPFAVHRYRKFGACPWGFGPGTTGLADARQLDFLERLADAAAEKAVFPPVAAPASLEGEIGLGAAEVTYGDDSDPNSLSMLREWAQVARYDFAKDRLADKRNQLKSVFHVDLFQLFSSRALERAPMTATEAQLVAGEKLTQFSPVFGRLVSEFLTPVLIRVFGLLLRRGAYGQLPASMIVNDKGGAKVAAPTVRYKNRIMLAMEQRNNQSLAEFIALTAPLIQTDPTALDGMNLPTILRETARNSGFPESWIRSTKETEAIQEARAQAAQQQAAIEAAQGVAKAGRDAAAMAPEDRDALRAV